MLILDALDRRPHTDEFLAALTGGGDSRLTLDPETGWNKYLVAPHPDPAVICFSSCTASPISNAGFLAAKRCFVDLTTTPSPDRVAAWEAKVKNRLASYLGTANLAEIELLPSGTDGLLFCSILLSLESAERPITAILPAAAETGTGVPRAAAGQPFDRPLSPTSIPGPVEIALRTPDGAPRDADEVSDNFASAAKHAPGRPVITLTYGSKTGLVAPLRIPPGANVIVDACQLRVAPSVIRACLRNGWPVVITGSKYLGGPPFSGAVLLPAGRFTSIRLHALARWRRTVLAPAQSAGPLLRWVAATEGLSDAEPPYQIPPTSAAIAALTRIPGLRVLPGPTEAMIDAAGAHPGIISFAINDLSAGQLRPLHRLLADSGVLLGQPVDIGPFGVLRLAFGRSHASNTSLHQDLARIAAELTALLAKREVDARLSGQSSDCPCGSGTHDPMGAGAHRDRSRTLLRVPGRGRVAAACISMGVVE
jgi:hypothetical protein